MTQLTLLRPELRCPARFDLPRTALHVGLTGGIGMGKSTVARLLQQHGVAVLDMDAHSKMLTAAHGAAIGPIRAQFGNEFIQTDGALHREKMRSLVFDDAMARAKLEAIIHPLIEQTLLASAWQCVQMHQQQVLVYDIPLLTQTSVWMERLDWVVVVHCSQNQQIERVMHRNSNISRYLVEKMINAQIHPSERLSLANVLIDNDKISNGYLHLHTQVAILCQELRYQVQKRLA